MCVRVCVCVRACMQRSVIFHCPLKWAVILCADFNEYSHFKNCTCMRVVWLLASKADFCIHASHSRDKRSSNGKANWYWILSEAPVQNCAQFPFIIKINSRVGLMNTMSNWASTCRNARMLSQPNLPVGFLTFSYTRSQCEWLCLALFQPWHCT